MVDRVLSFESRSKARSYRSEFSVQIKFGALVGLTALFFLLEGGPQLAAKCMSDAFFQVTVFVAATLGFFYFLQAWYKIDATVLLARHYKWQVPIAAGLGALPGCGGAIIVITQFLRGGLNFGSVVAVLTATMGDAAFLLLAKDPSAGFSVLVIGFFIGIISGYTVDKIHSPAFLRQNDQFTGSDNRPHIRYVGSSIYRSLWILFLIPGLIFGGFVAFQSNTSAIFGFLWGLETITWVGLAGGAITLLLWASMRHPDRDTEVADNSGSDRNSTRKRRIEDATSRVVGDTCFVTVWVAFAFLTYEVSVSYLGLDIRYFFDMTASLVPLLAILVGLIPGCGPQVVIASMYISGVIPFSAEIGNSISNDGDALFPAIAIAPRVAAIATIYSALPAFVVAYGYYWLFE